MDTRNDKLRKLIDGIFYVHQHEPIDCQTCSDHWDCLVELVMRGANVGELLPAVEEHLRCCPDCKEEFDALLAILRAEESGAAHTVSDDAP